MMLKMMWLASLLIFISIGGYFCDDDDDDGGFNCFIKKRDECDEYEPSREFPQTAEELLAGCRALEALGKCIIEAKESCYGSQDFLTNHIQEVIDYVKATCQEDTPTFKAITTNLPCIERVVKSREDIRCISILSEQNIETIDAHIDLLIGHGDKGDLAYCLYDIMDVTCEGIVFGHHCGEEVKDAVEEIEAHLHSPNSFQCTPEQLEELSPFMRMFEGLLVEELALQNALKRRRK